MNIILNWQRYIKEQDEPATKNKKQKRLSTFHTITMRKPKKRVRSHSQCELRAQIVHYWIDHMDVLELEIFQFVARMSEGEEFDSIQTRDVIY